MLICKQLTFADSAVRVLFFLGRSVGDFALELYIKAKVSFPKYTNECYFFFIPKTLLAPEINKISTVIKI